MGSIWTKQAAADTDPHEEELRSDPNLSRSLYPRHDGLSLRLSSGRVLGYAQYGNPEAPATRTLLFLHGTPGTRFFWHRRHSDDAVRAGVRVIVPERPGFGLSTPDRNRTILSHAKDLEELLDSLKIDHAIAVGFSAGGAYALGAAYILRERLSKVVVVSSLSPPLVGVAGAVTEGMSSMAWIAYFLCRRIPFAVKWIVRCMSRQDVQNIFEPTRNELQEEENHVFRNDVELRRLIATSTLELYSRPHGADAEAEDYVLFGRDWGFKLTDLPPEIPVYVYGGMIDDKTTPNMWRLIVQECPNVSKQSHLQPGKGHLYFYELFPRILQDLGFG